jgi:hypothetical protein
LIAIIGSITVDGNDGFFYQPCLRFQAATQRGWFLSVRANDVIADRTTINAPPPVKSRQKALLWIEDVLLDDEAFTARTTHATTLNA